MSEAVNRLVPERGTLLLPFRDRTSAPSLSLGIVVDEQRPPWIGAFLAFLQELPEFQVRVLPVKAAAASPVLHSSLTQRLYAASRERLDPFGDLPSFRNPIPDPASLEALQAARCGALIWLSRCQPESLPLFNLAEHGIFTVRFGDGLGPLPFWHEAVNNSLTSATTVYWHDTSFAHGRPLRSAELATSRGLFFTDSAQQPVLAAVRMIVALCFQLQNSPVNFRLQLEKSPSIALRPFSADAPSGFEAAGFAASKLLRSAWLSWKNRGKAPKWFVAVRPNRGITPSDSGNHTLAGFRDIPLPRGMEQMADPFLWQHGNTTHLLFEAVSAGQTKGWLGAAELAPDGTCSEIQTILDRPYHLSYPCVVAQDNDLFLLPETSDANRVELYRFSTFPGELEHVASPVEGSALVDTTPIFHDGYWYFFTTTVEPFMETFLFCAARLEGPWQLHPTNPVSSSVSNSRSAGQLFWKAGRLYRPTQDCSVRYGYAMVLNEVTRLTPHEFQEREVSRILPTWAPGLLGTHTWNESSSFQVIDGLSLLS